MDIKIVKSIYYDIFREIQCSNIDLFLCGGASNKTYESSRDKLRRRLEDDKRISIFYPEDMFMELLSRKKYDLFTLENFLAKNSDLIMIVCESPGSFTELGAFASNEDTLDKLVVLIHKKYKNDKSFIIQGPVRYIETHNRKNVIYFNNDLNDMEKEIRAYLSSKYWFFGDKKYIKRYGDYTKEINLISGQFHFVLLLLYFYNKIEVKEMYEKIRYLYTDRGFELDKFEILYTAALKRLYKEGMIIKNIEEEVNYYKLTKKGYGSVKALLRDVIVGDRDKLINGIRIGIISDQYR